MLRCAEIDSEVVARIIVAPSAQWCESRYGGQWVEVDVYLDMGRGDHYDPSWPFSYAREWQQPQAELGEPHFGYRVGQQVWHSGQFWNSTIDYNVWEPGVSGWRAEPSERGVPAAWVQPTGAHDAYRILVDSEGESHPEQVTHNGQVWVTVVDNNVWEPGVHGWEVV